MSTQPKPKPPPEHTAEIIPFERRAKAASPQPVESLGKFSRAPSEPDDYAHRQKTNAAALIVLLLLVIGGVWLAIKLSELRRAQDCVVGGRRDCTQVISPPTIRH